MGDVAAASVEIAHVEPRLPPELERIIFELAARSSRKRVAPVLMLVARRVREWLEPLQHEIVVRYFDGEGRKPTGASIHHIRHILFATTVTTLETKTYLSQCHNVYNLALWSHVDADSLAVLTAVLRSPHRRSTTPPFRRLSTSLSDLFSQNVDFHHAIFRHITHLDVVDRWDAWEKDNNFACLPALTHLAFNSESPITIIANCLSRCPKLELLVILGVRHVDELKAQIPPFRTKNVFDKKTGAMVTVRTDVPEDRVVMNLPEGPGGWIGDWVRSAECGDDFWSRGEEIVKRRRRNRAVSTAAWCPVLDGLAEEGEGEDVGEWMGVLERLSLRA
ncbi:hypothetical protein AX16_000723 [Volvariella volvacea WC 439]|nr:hypothetical protein AX16_000723 [Volvariella volvacea WC 439]